MGKRPLTAVTVVLLAAGGFPGQVVAVRAGENPPAAPVDATSLRGKVLCGYQGWFRCPGDGSGEGWVHWGRDPKRLNPATLTVEMWPDLADFPAAERYPAPGFTHPGGGQ